jgi:GTP-binding protein
LRNQLLTATAGSYYVTPFHRIRPFKEIPGRNNGSLISMDGKAIPYSIDKLQDRGKFFVNQMMKFMKVSNWRKFS